MPELANVGNAFTANTNAVIASNTILNGDGPQAGGVEMGSGNFVVSERRIHNWQPGRRI